ncbi:MAG TPA: hypothetical protein DIC26_08370, partial [Pseudomonas sp.]|nr:hypothetical protein [Pseudomonas sp.]
MPASRALPGAIWRGNAARDETTTDPTTRLATPDTHGSGQNVTRGTQAQGPSTHRPELGQGAPGAGRTAAKQVLP